MVTTEHRFYIVYCFATAAIAIAAHRVVVVLRIGLPQDHLLHVAIPSLGVAAILGCKGHGIEHVTSSGVVGCDYKLESLVAVGNAAGKFVIELA